MRELKFRALDKVSKSMSPAFSLFGEFTLLGAVFAWLDHVRCKPDGTSGLMSLNDLCILQSTGIYDAKGIEIFEGDILSDSFGDLGLVKWIGQDAGFDIIDAEEIRINGIDCIDPAYIMDTSGGFSGMEFIGSYYQNPELLENKNG